MLWRVPAWAALRSGDHTQLLSMCMASFKTTRHGHDRPNSALIAQAQSVKFSGGLACAAVRPSVGFHLHYAVVITLSSSACAWLASKTTRHVHDRPNSALIAQAQACIVPVRALHPAQHPVHRASLQADLLSVQILTRASLCCGESQRGFQAALGHSTGPWQLLLFRLIRVQLSQNHGSTKPMWLHKPGREKKIKSPQREKCTFAVGQLG